VIIESPKFGSLGRAAGWDKQQVCRIASSSAMSALPPECHVLPLLSFREQG